MKQPTEACPTDGCRFGVFARVSLWLGVTIELQGCHYCEFDHVTARATDRTGLNRLVGRWAYDADCGLYVVTEKPERTPPEWFDAACAALPR